MSGSSTLSEGTSVSRGGEQGDGEASHKIMPTTYFTILLLLSIGSHLLYRVRIVGPPYTYAGIPLVALGAALNVWTDTLFKEAGTTVKPHLSPSALITSGPFGISRHPMYLGMAAVLLGSAVFMGSPIPFLSPVAYAFLMERIFIPIEERNLESCFGDEYLDYRKRVRRWI